MNDHYVNILKIMKTIKKFTLASIIMLFVAISFVSCTKDENQNDKAAPGVSQTQVTTPSVNSDIYIINNILAFKSKAAFDKTYSDLIFMSREQSEEWERNQGFVSQRSIFNKIVDAENDWDLKCRELSPELLKSTNHHSDTYYSYLKEGFVKVIDAGTENETYNYSVYNPVFTCVLNKEGLLIINDTIYQLSNDKLKIITDGDINKIKLLANSNQTDASNNIIINKMKNETKQSDGIFDWNEDSGWYSSGNCNNCKRILLLASFASNLSGGGITCFATHNINVQCQERNFWGTWKFVFTPTTINGRWESRLKLLDGTTYNYSPTFYYYYSINNLFASVSPTISNSTAFYPSVFSYTAPSGNNFWYELEVYNYYWTASRNGGSSGLTAIIPYIPH